VCCCRDIIVTGDQLDRRFGRLLEGRPAVFVNLDARARGACCETTQRKSEPPMAVLFIEERATWKSATASWSKSPSRARVISVATIRGVFSSRFQITGLTHRGARPGAAAARRRAGGADLQGRGAHHRPEPRPGQHRPRHAAVVARLRAGRAVHALYYRVFGLVANVALLVNLVLIVALLSLLQAALTLPGIAGIVLTVGMAVDANVLIFERIREELRNGNTPQAAITAGYDKAFSTIADANITTLIAAVVLFTFGTGPDQAASRSRCRSASSPRCSPPSSARAPWSILIYGKARADPVHRRSMVHAAS
jgi:preprotein translocase subunit SecD